MIDTGEGRARHETWEYVPAEYLSHDAPGYSQLLSAGGILATDSEGEVYWVIEGEIEPKIGKRIVAAVNRHDELLAALKQLVSDVEYYEHTNNLAPNPGRKHCWDSVARAHAIIDKAEGASLTTGDRRDG